jgi:hypothetical protein
MRGVCMKYLILQGSSINKVLVECKRCRKKFVWLRAYKHDDGLYFAMCAKCKRERKNEKQKTLD